MVCSWKTVVSKIELLYEFMHKFIIDCYGFLSGVVDENPFHIDFLARFRYGKSLWNSYGSFQKN